MIRALPRAIASSASTTPASSRSARSPSATCNSTEATGAPVRSATRHAPATRARPSCPGVCATSCSAAGTSPPRVATAETGARASQSVAASASAAVGICPARSSMARPTVTRVVSSARLRRMRSAAARRSTHATVPTAMAATRPQPAALIPNTTATATRPAARTITTGRDVFLTAAALSRPGPRRAGVSSLSKFCSFPTSSAAARAKNSTQISIATTPASRARGPLPAPRWWSRRRWSWRARSRPAHPRPA